MRREKEVAYFLVSLKEEKKKASYGDVQERKNERKYKGRGASLPEDHRVPG